MHYDPHERSFFNILHSTISNVKYCVELHIKVTDGKKEYLFEKGKRYWHDRILTIGCFLFNSARDGEGARWCRHAARSAVWVVERSRVWFSNSPPGRCWRMMHDNTSRCKNSSRHLSSKSREWVAASWKVSPPSSLRHRYASP